MSYRHTKVVVVVVGSVAVAAGRVTGPTLVVRHTVEVEHWAPNTWRTLVAAQTKQVRWNGNTALRTPLREAAAVRDSRPTDSARDDCSSW